MTTYPLHLADDMMEEAKRAAAEDNVSLNQLFSTFIAEGMGHRQALLTLRGRAAQADVTAALAILQKAPDVPPDAGDDVREL